MKRLALAALAFGLLFCGRKDARAASQACLYANGVPPTNATCQAWFGDGMYGAAAQTFTNSLGVNTHFSYSQYQTNATYFTHVLTALGIKHIRDDGIASISSGSTTQTDLNNLVANGIKIDLIANPPTSAGALATAYGFITAGGVEAVENYNEYAESSSSAPATLYTEQQTLFNEARTLNSSIAVYGPSLASIPDYTLFGNDFSPYEDSSVTHEYTGKYNPESTGWYGQTNPAGYQQDSIPLWMYSAKFLAPSKPIISTENGECTNNSGSPGNGVCVTTLEQGTYLLRHWMTIYKLGYALNYVYMLAESQNADSFSWGLINFDGTQKPALAVLNGFLTIAHDASTLPGPCILPVKSVSGAVNTFGICKSDGSYDLMLWQPVQSYNPNSNTSNTTGAVSATVTFSNEFFPTRLRAWNYTPSTGAWANGTISPASSISTNVTDTVTMLEINGPASAVSITAVPTS